MFAKLLGGTVAIGLLIGFVMPSRQVAPPPPLKPMPGTIAGIDTVLQRKGDGHFYVDALVNGQSVHFVVDTGASIVALTEEDARRVGIPFSQNNYRVVGSGASGDVTGEDVTIHQLSIDQKETFDVSGAVLRGLDISLLGQSYLAQIGSVEIKGDKMILR
jgi:aspartyl protease family protein